MWIRSALILTLFAAFTLWERRKPFDGRERLSLRVNIALGLLSFTVAITLFFVLGKTTTLFSPLLRTPNVWDVCLAIVLLDFVSYLWHWASHTLPPLWRLHRTHHSERALHTSSAFRFHAIETTLSLIPRWACILALQIPLLAVVVFEVLFQTANMFQHSNLRLPDALERMVSKIFVTPTIHRRHHSLEWREHNSNYGTIFSFWDRALKTYQDNFSESVRDFGLKDQPRELTLKDALLLPFKF